MLKYWHYCEIKNNFFYQQYLINSVLSVSKGVIKKIKIPLLCVILGDLVIMPFNNIKQVKLNWIIKDFAPDTLKL